jgi:hypothetical protein
MFHSSGHEPSVVGSVVGSVAVRAGPSSVHVRGTPWASMNTGHGVNRQPRVVVRSARCATPSAPAASSGCLTIGPGKPPIASRPNPESSTTSGRCSTRNTCWALIPATCAAAYGPPCRRCLVGALSAPGVLTGWALTGWALPGGEVAESLFEERDSDQHRRHRQKPPPTPHIVRIPSRSPPAQQLSPDAHNVDALSFSTGRQDGEAGRGGNTAVCPTGLWFCRWWSSPCSYPFSPCSCHFGNIIP